MEDENGLELSLGLSCGGSTGKSKTSDVPPDPTVEEGNSSRLIGGNTDASDVPLKNFFELGTEKQDHDGKQNTDQVTRQCEAFLTGLGKCSAPAADSSNDPHNNVSQFSRFQELWLSNNKTNGNEEEKSVLNKRKMPFEEISLQKKHEKTVDYVDSHGKTPTGVTSVRKNSHVSATTEDGSFGENEDVAESEAEGSNSWLISQREDSSRCSETLKYTDKHVLSDPSGIGSQEQKQPLSGNESNPELGQVAYGVPLSLQPLTVMTVPYPVPVKVPTAANAPNVSGFPSPCVMQLMTLPNGERPVIQTMNTSNLPLAFGYSPVQLPTLDTNSSWAFNSQPSRVTSIVNRDHADRTPNLEHSENETKIPHASVQAPHTSGTLGYERNSSNLANGSSKHAGEAGISAQTEDEANGKNTIFRSKEAANRSVVEGVPHEGSIIRPGIAPNVKIGGCGSYPDLPWVSTTGPGSNGKTISGVTYKYNKNQIKIVCACHGSHMSPEEFVQHASADDLNTENNMSLT